MKMKFYKYLRDSQYVENFFKQKVFLTRLGSFNDPFEGRFRLIPPSTEEFLENPELLSVYLEQHQKNKPILKEEFLKKSEDAEFRDELDKNKFCPPIFNDHGALCLTARNDNIPMWAYYANDHKGCCIEFELDFSRIQKDSNLALDKVEEYISNIRSGNDILSFQQKLDPDKFFYFLKVRHNEGGSFPEIKIAEHAKFETEYEKNKYLLMNSVGVKHVQWKHEEEYRLVVNYCSRDGEDLMYLPGYAPFLKITGIILGSKIEKHNEDAIRDMCKMYDMNLFKATCSENSYDINIVSC